MSTRMNKIWAVRTRSGQLLVWPGDRRKPTRRSHLMELRPWQVRRFRWERWTAKSPDGRGQPMQARMGPCLVGLRDVGIDLTDLPLNQPVRITVGFGIPR